MAYEKLLQEEERRELVPYHLLYEGRKYIKVLLVKPYLDARGFGLARRL